MTDRLALPTTTEIDLRKRLFRACGMRAARRLWYKSIGDFLRRFIPPIWVYRSFCLL